MTYGLIPDAGYSGRCRKGALFFLSALRTDDLDDWLERMVAHHRQPGPKLLGGCCGTDGSYLAELVRSILASP